MTSPASGPSIAIVGAGLAGAIAAQTLQAHGARPVVFEKSRGPGGRCATRRMDEVGFDHGAQYFTVRDPRIKERLPEWLRAGVVAPWQARIVARDNDQWIAKPQPTRYVGVPGMSALAGALLQGIETHFDVRVSGLEATAHGWRVRSNVSQDGRVFDRVLVTAPPPQASVLLQAAPPLARAADAVAMAPCWAAMFTFDAPIEVHFDGAFANHPNISWLARNNSKPGRPPREAWVVHASENWSRRHLEVSPEAVLPELLALFFEISGARPRPALHRAAHRWRYARPTSALDEPCLVAPEWGLAVAGDAYTGGRIEGALLSGLLASERLLS